MDGPLEPTSSTTANATDASDDPSFVNFFSVCLPYLSKFPNFSESLVLGRRLELKHYCYKCISFCHVFE